MEQFKLKYRFLEEINMELKSKLAESNNRLQKAEAKVAAFESAIKP